MKFATPLTLALVITSRIGSADADAERTSANGLIDLEVGWNEKVRGLPTYVEVGVFSRFTKQAAFMPLPFLSRYIYLIRLSPLNLYLNCITIIPGASFIPCRAPPE